MSCNYLGRNNTLICKVAKKFAKETEKEHPVTESEKTERRGCSKRKGKWSCVSKDSPSSTELREKCHQIQSARRGEDSEKRGDKDFESQKDTSPTLHEKKGEKGPDTDKLVHLLVG